MWDILICALLWDTAPVCTLLHPVPPCYTLFHSVPGTAWFGSTTRLSGHMFRFNSPFCHHLIWCDNINVIISLNPWYLWCASLTCFFETPYKVIPLTHGVDLKVPRVVVEKLDFRAKEEDSVQRQKVADVGQNNAPTNKVKKPLVKIWGACNIQCVNYLSFSWETLVRNLPPFKTLCDRRTWISVVFPRVGE